MPSCAAPASASTASAAKANQPHWALDWALAPRKQLLDASGLDRVTKREPYSCAKSANGEGRNRTADTTIFSAVHAWDRRGHAVQGE
jgi:hypothetical protein